MSDSHACAVCGRILVRITQGENLWFEHALIDLPSDHVPIAVRAEEVEKQVRYRCDFCLEEPITHTLVVDKVIEVGDQRFDPEWAMCAVCSEFAFSDDWLNLRRRAFKSFEAQFGPMTPEVQIMLRLAYKDLRDHKVMFYAEA